LLPISLSFLTSLD